MGLPIKNDDFPLLFVTVHQAGYRPSTPCRQVLEEYQEHEIQGILDVAMAPEPRAEEELPKLMRGEDMRSRQSL